jgi:asparagine N-glycosylation enzyme membrane subunit Stt3
MVARLRNRKGRIIAWSGLSVFFLVMLALHLLMLTRMLTDLLHIESERMVRAVLFGVVSLEIVAFLLALGLAAAVAALITEFTVFTKSELLVNLWDRVRALEQSQAVPANSQEPRSPASGGEPSCP